jgi:hypothetical protein
MGQTSLWTDRLGASDSNQTLYKFWKNTNSQRYDVILGR